MAITQDQYTLLVAAPMLQDYLVDKDTGTPLAGGIVTFYKDDERTILKNVYYQTGSPGNYSYIPLPNPLTLTSVGTIANDNGDDVIPFYFPYNEDDDTVLQKYYVTVYSASSDSLPAIPQWTRENFPPLAQQNNPDTSQQDLINLIPNGQFASHNNLENNGLFPNGHSSITVAQGGSAGWYYVKSNTSTDTDYVTFTQILQEPDNLSGNPRFAINIRCDSASGNDVFKELRMRFNNVNRFASDSQFYTFSFSGKSNTSSSVEVILAIIKYFGSGGSSPSETEVQSFTLTAGLFDSFSTSFVFGLNSAATIGPNNDDYVELLVAVPSSETFNLEMTNFLLTPGFMNITDYPERPDNMVFANAISGSLPTPNPDGSDLGLPIISTLAGAIYDTSVIGDIIDNVSSSRSGPVLPCDQSVYLSSGYSSLGIPYSRLQKFLKAKAPAVAQISGIPMYGTGSTYATGYINSSINNYVRLTTNKPGSQTSSSDGAVPTGFTFSNIHIGQSTGVKAYSNGANSVLGISDTIGNVFVATSGNSGFTVTQLVNTGLSYASFIVSTTAASSITAGHYFTFSTPSTSFYCWFKIDGVGTDPAPGGTGIEIDLLSTYGAQEVANCIQEGISGYQVSLIQCNAANTITSGSYWNFNANSVTYSPVYLINSSILPILANPIIINLTGSETNSQVATLTAIAINNLYFATPDFRGLFLRGLTGDGQFDIDVNSRFSSISGVYGNHVGTFELDTNQSHQHQIFGSSSSGSGGLQIAQLTNAASVSSVFGFTVSNLSSGFTGNAESQGVNAAVGKYIRY